MRALVFKAEKNLRTPDPKLHDCARIVKGVVAMKFLPPFSLCIAALTTALQAADFVSLFNGRDLEGWEQHSGKAEYRVEDGAIVGKTVANTGNSFLCSKKL